MGRNARRRAESKGAAHPHGVEPEPTESHGTSSVRCPMCGSTNVFIGRTHAFQRYLDVICGHCNSQGELPSNYW